jgi:hypothetical protein
MAIVDNSQLRLFTDYRSDSYDDYINSFNDYMHLFEIDNRPVYIINHSVMKDLYLKKVPAFSCITYPGCVSWL